MVIICSDRNEIINFDNVQTLNVMGRYVHATMSDNKTVMIGAYKDNDRAIEVFAEMMKSLFPDPEDDEMFDKLMPFIDASSGDFEDGDIPIFPSLPPQYYYMPKE